ncbi:MAG: hypothetical protein EOP48_07970 [Sphingobacteriales bacterium]|nr:MAG: hypothetical protein EOP48_07970 [Sphingobacteriales bacterium]
MRRTNLVFIFLSIFLSTLCLSSRAQAGDSEGFEKRKESALINLRNHSRPDTARVEALMNVLYAAIFLEERKDVALYLTEAFSLSRKLQYINGVGNYRWWPFSKQKHRLILPCWYST